MAEHDDFDFDPSLEEEDELQQMEQRHDDDVLEHEQDEQSGEEEEAEAQARTTDPPRRAAAAPSTFAPSKPTVRDLKSSYAQPVPNFAAALPAAAAAAPAAVGTTHAQSQRQRKAPGVTASALHQRSKSGAPRPLGGTSARGGVGGGISASSGYASKHIGRGSAVVPSVVPGGGSIALAPGAAEYLADAPPHDAQAQAQAQQQNEANAYAPQQWESAAAVAAQPAFPYGVVAPYSPTHAYAPYGVADPYAQQHSAYYGQPPYPHPAYAQPAYPPPAHAAGYNYPPPPPAASAAYPYPDPYAGPYAQQPELSDEYDGYDEPPQQQQSQHPPARAARSRPAQPSTGSYAAGAPVPAADARSGRRVVVNPNPTATHARVSSTSQSAARGRAAPAAADAPKPLRAGAGLGAGASALAKMSPSGAARRPSEYRAYSLSDYRDLNLDVRLGGLGPDLDNEERKAKEEKNARIRALAQQIREDNAAKLASAPPPRVREAVKEPSAAERRKEFAKGVPKPQPRVARRDPTTIEGDEAHEGPHLVPHRAAPANAKKSNSPERHKHNSASAANSGTHTRSGSGSASASSNGGAMGRRRDSSVPTSANSSDGADLQAQLNRQAAQRRQVDEMKRAMGL